MKRTRLPETAGGFCGGENQDLVRDSEIPGLFQICWSTQYMMHWHDKFIIDKLAIGEPQASGI